MVQHGVLQDGTKLLDAFMNTDRGDFVLDSDRYSIYSMSNIDIEAFQKYIFILLLI